MAWAASGLLLVDMRDGDFGTCRLGTGGPAGGRHAQAPVTCHACSRDLQAGTASTLQGLPWLLAAGLEGVREGWRLGLCDRWQQQCPLTGVLGDVG